MPTVFVTDETIELFRNAVLARHGKLYAKLREEADVALREHAARLMDETDGMPPRRHSSATQARPAKEVPRKESTDGSYPQIKL